MKAVLFDLEGTLVESIYQRKPEIIDKLRRETKELLIDSGVPAALLEGMVRSFALRNIAYGWADENLSPMEANGLRRKVQEFMLGYDMDSARQATLYPDTKGALERLEDEGVTMGVVTNTSSAAAMHVIERFDLGGFFGAVVSRSDVPRLKPDPAMIRLAEERMGLEANWLVGDAMFDAGAARNSGIASIIVRRDGVRPSFDHDHFIESLDDLPPLLGLDNPTANG